VCCEVILGRSSWSKEMEVESHFKTWVDRDEEDMVPIKRRRMQVNMSKLRWAYSIPPFARLPLSVPPPSGQ